MASATNRVLTDHDEIRRWAEERDASPACVRGTGADNDIGILRLDFPGYTGARSLEHIDWDEWLDKFDERGLALLVQDRTSRGERSNFNKIVSRETAQAGRNGRSRSSSSRTSTRSRTASRTRTAAKPRATAKKKSAATKKRTAKKSASTRRASAARRTSSSRATSARSTRSAAKRTSRTKTPSSASTRSDSTRSRRSTSTRSKSSGRAISGRSNVRSIRNGRSSSNSHVLTDHDEIRRWAEERDAAPACVRGTGGGKDPGMIRLDFPGFSGARSLEHIDWNEWFRAFDDNNLALLVQDTRAGGGSSNFNKLIGRETAERRARGERKSSRRHPEKAATSRTRASAGNASTKKATRGSTRAHRTESVRGRTTSQRRAA